MLKVISDLTQCQRITREYVQGVVDSGVAGTWVTLNASNQFDITGATTTGLSYVVWNESNRDGTVGFTPDVAAIGKVTALLGPLRAQTDQVTDYAGLAVGVSLVSKAGKLAAMSVGEEDDVVAYVARKIDSLNHLGTTFSNVIEFWTK